MLKEIFFILWILLQVYIGWHLFLPFILFVFYKLVSLFKKKDNHLGREVQYSDYAVIVTAYEQLTNIPNVVQSILNLDYPDFIVYLVADKCDITGLHFEDERVVILRPEETLSSNTRSHFYAINRFKRPHERLTIIDSDNLVEPDFLRKLDVFFDKGFLAVQGVRNAKNLDTEYARLDAARDIYYHFYDGKILFGLGSSATLAGSGMAFTTALYKDCLESKDITGAGFDKVLQAEILKRDVRIAFAEDAIIYDEKTSKSDQLVNQRARWINTWFRYFKYGFQIIARGVKNFSLNQFLFGIVLLRPPLFIKLGFAIVFIVIDLYISPIESVVWVAGLIFFVVGFATALLNSKTDRVIYKSLVSIPKFIFFQVISLLNAVRANKRSVATKHFHHSDSSLDNK